ncbi:MAG: hypothetical protein ACTHLN_03005 [Tepidisphaeraceae bacterium]
MGQININKLYAEMDKRSLSGLVRAAKDNVAKKETSDARKKESQEKAVACPAAR